MSEAHKEYFEADCQYYEDKNDFLWQKIELLQKNVVYDKLYILLKRGSYQITLRTHYRM